MIKLKMSDISNIIDGKVIYGDENAEVEKVIQDSRLGVSNSLFFAIKGINQDGHKYIEDVLLKGCSCIVVSDETVIQEEIVKEKNPTVVLVEDTEKALRSLAKWYIDSFETLKKIAVTGSTGKTTTRNMIYSLCKNKFITHKNKGNYNSDIGVPLTILDMPKETEVLVVEMGMDKKGEIDKSSELVTPDIAVITNIGVSHIEILGSRREIFNAKMEIVNHMAEDGILIVFEDEEYLNKNSIEQYIQGKNISSIKEIIVLGESQRANKTLNIKEDRKFDIQDEIYEINLRGRHNIFNATLAIEVAKQIGVDDKSIKNNLLNIENEKGRLQEIYVKNIKIIDDTYNASPDSMKSALNVLSEFNNQRKIAVLGDMYELGQDSKRLHKEVGVYAKDKADIVITIGKLAESMEGDFSFDDKSKLLIWLKENINENDAILFKASRGIKLDEAVDEIIKYINIGDTVNEF